jgi:hypothetical protein
MPAYNFQSRFAAAVEAGRKAQTIRAPRKDGRVPQPGQTAYLYTGMRSSACRKLGEGRIIEAKNILIDEDGAFISDVSLPLCDALANDGAYKVLTEGKRDVFAQADGFTDWQEMVSWFRATHGLPFVGHLIMWDLR